MATYYPSITDDQAALIRNAPLFFVASADPTCSRPAPKALAQSTSRPRAAYRYT